MLYQLKASNDLPALFSSSHNDIYSLGWIQEIPHIEDVKFWQLNDLNGLNLKQLQFRFLQEQFKNGNVLLNGDNLVGLSILRYLQNRDYLSPVDLIYIDPPYNTGMVFHRYDDNYNHDIWLSMMQTRLQLMKEVLSPSGIILVQLDDNELSYLDLILQEIFGIRNRLGMFIWRRRQSQANLIKTISSIHDYILVYCKDRNQVSEEKLKTIKDLQLLTNPARYGHNQMATKEIHSYFGDKRIFDTPKPEILLYHLISSLSCPNDLILDCFSGSGTTLAVAQKIQRRWIGMELYPKSSHLIHQRIQKIMKNQIETKIDSLITEQNQSNANSSKFQHISMVTSIGSLKSIDIPTFSSDISFLTSDLDISSFVKKIPKPNPIIKNNELFSSSLDFYKSGGSILTNKNNALFQVIFWAPPLRFYQDNEDNQNNQNISQNLNERFVAYFNQVVGNLVDRITSTGFFILKIPEIYLSSLKSLLDQYFGRKNYVSTLIWQKWSDYTTFRVSTKKLFPLWYQQEDYDIILIYAKDLSEMRFNQLPPSPDAYSNRDNDPRGPWIADPLVASAKSTNKVFTYTFKNGVTHRKRWRYPFHSIKRLEAENRLHYTRPKHGMGIPRVKKFYSERIKSFHSTGKHGRTPNSLLLEDPTYGNYDDWFQHLDIWEDSSFTEQQIRNQIEKYISTYTPSITPTLYQFLLSMTRISSESVLCLDGFYFFPEKIHPNKILFGM